ncbi:DUF2178 domain-containing protein [Methanothrix sp.]|uniref:DUF2178 domain-containing protein n=2 Tax=Methanothrix sp. TaxID=90426 RepID=UPI003C7371CF
MDVRGSKICRMAIIVSMVALVGWFTAAGNALLVAISITTGVVLLYLCKSKIKEVVEDERDVKVSEKASKLAIEIFAATNILIGVVLIALRYRCSEYTNIGFTLAFSASSLMILYSLLYGYYNKKYGYEPPNEE